MKFFPTLSSALAVAVAAGQASTTTPELEARSTASDIWGAIENAATCTACETALALLKVVAAFGDTFFVDVLTEVCKLSGAEDDDVCKGAIALEGPIIAHDLRTFSIGSKTSQLFCITFLGLCDYPDVVPYSPVSSTEPSGSRPSPSGQNPIQIVHYSDIHPDLFYVEGANANCTKPICCRSYTTADAPGNNDDPAGKFGMHTCDSPTTLEDSMYAAIQSIAPNARFALFTGDIVDHAVWNTTQAQNTIDINDAYGRMEDMGLAIYGTIGNHEANPTNAFQPTAVGSNSQWVYNLISSIWTQWIGATAASSEQSFGAYSAKYGSTNLRVISLNTNMYYIQNYWLYEKTMEKDPSGQLAWLVSELQSAEDAGERVYILGHMPLGESDAFHDASNYFDQIVNRYSNTIAALFFGHTHKDHFEIAYSSYDARSFSTAVAISYICPSMTPTDGMPAFRVYDVDPETFAILDSTTYIADMTNSAFQTNPVWTKYYSAKEAYGPLVGVTDSDAELSPAFWHNVTSVFESNSTAFDEYYARKTRGWDVSSCTGSCATTEICQLRAARAQDNCYEPSFGVNFKKAKREEPVSAAHSDCGVSVSREAVVGMVSNFDAIEFIVNKIEAKNSSIAGNLTSIIRRRR